MWVNLVFPYSLQTESMALVTSSTGPAKKLALVGARNFLKGDTDKTLGDLKMHLNIVWWNLVTFQIFPLYPKSTSSIFPTLVNINSILKDLGIELNLSPFS